MNKRGIAAFYKYARARQQILLNRRAGLPRERWTKDPIFREYSFCNVFREDDRNTVWYRENVREKYGDQPEIVLATVVFRLFNRIETCEAIFRDDDLLGGHSAFDKFAEDGKISHLKQSIIRRLGKRGPYTTGSYIISSPPGYTKLDGVLEVIRRFHRTPQPTPDMLADVKLTMNWLSIGQVLLRAKRMRLPPPSLRCVWDWLCHHDYMGTFHSYEVVTDLRHSVLSTAPDIMTWASPGPGARRGLCRVQGRDLWDHTVPRSQLIDEMRTLLSWSRSADHWPQTDAASCGDGNFDGRVRRLVKRDWPAWEMRDVEHTLCEFDKYERTRAGDGRPRSRFHPKERLP